MYSNLRSAIAFISKQNLKQMKNSKDKKQVQSIIEQEILNEERKAREGVEMVKVKRGGTIKYKTVDHNKNKLLL